MQSRTYISQRTLAPAILAAAMAFASASFADEVATADTSAASAAKAGASSVLMADKLVVRKAERRLYVMRAGQVLKEYRVALGLSPSGHKQQEGDYKTPEGSYRLIRRNPRSDFFLSMEISYPNAKDAARAQRQGVRPGGAIMLHGWPNNPRKGAEYYKSADWTDGCIAVSNSDMVEIWLMTPLETPIDILP
jgi:murein L,D-transpeptidase YafK